MITRTLYLLIFTGGLTAALTSGCGGKVIVDGTGNEGGNAGQGSSYIATSASGGASCELPMPVGSVTLCGGVTTTTGPGSSDLCSVKLCDRKLNIYEANCTDTSCDCSFKSADGNQNVGCTCTLPTTCSNTIPCCGFAFTQ